MVINVDKLKERGIAVRIFEDLGDGSKRERKLVSPVVEVFAEHGEGLKQGTLDDVRSRLTTPEYQEVVVEGLIKRVHTMQVLEAIEATSKE